MSGDGLIPQSRNNIFERLIRYIYKTKCRLIREVNHPKSKNINTGNENGIKLNNAQPLEGVTTEYFLKKQTSLFNPDAFDGGV